MRALEKPYFLLKLEGLPLVIACQAFKNCDRILLGLKKNHNNLLEKSPFVWIQTQMDSPSISLSPWISYNKKKRDVKWKTWLHEYVYSDFRDDTSVLKRFQCFQYFCSAGLIPFVEAPKYNFNVNCNIANELANLLFRGEDFFQRSQPFYRIQSLRAKMDLDYDYYISRGIPDCDWEAFWKEWQWMSDFYDENYRNRFLISKFVYERLSLEISDATEILTREIEGEEDYDDYNPINEHASDAIGQGKDRNSLY